MPQLTAHTGILVAEHPDLPGCGVGGGLHRIKTLVDAPVQLLQDRRDLGTPRRKALAGSGHRERRRARAVPLPLVCGLPQHGAYGVQRPIDVEVESRYDNPPVQSTLVYASV